MQVHRYLDPGAELDICHAPMDSLCAGAMQVLLSYGERKPALLAEGGAVKPNHTGPSDLYSADTLGVLLHDVLFTPFFTGSAGSGHSWHWDHYVDRNNLWWHFGRFASAVNGIDPGREGFEPVRCDAEGLRAYALQGKHTLLIWLRDTLATWKSEFEQGIVVRTVKNATIRLSALPTGTKVKKAEGYDPWADRRVTLSISTTQHRNVLEDRILSGDVPVTVLPDFRRSYVLKISY